MPEISNKKLERWMRIEEASRYSVEVHGGGDSRERLIKALDPVPPPLVSDEELRELGITGPGPIAIAHRLISRAFRNAAEKLQKEHSPTVGEYTLAILRQWSDEEDSP